MSNRTVVPLAFVSLLLLVSLLESSNAQDQAKDAVPALIANLRDKDHKVR